MGQPDVYTVFNTKYGRFYEITNITLSFPVPVINTLNNSVVANGDYYALLGKYKDKYVVCDAYRRISMCTKDYLPKHLCNVLPSKAGKLYIMGIKKAYAFQPLDLTYFFDNTEQMAAFASIYEQS
jgi:hypothetical protein